MVANHHQKFNSGEEWHNSVEMSGAGHARPLSLDGLSHLSLAFGISSWHQTRFTVIHGLYQGTITSREMFKCKSKNLIVALETKFYHMFFTFSGIGFSLQRTETSHKLMPRFSFLNIAASCNQYHTWNQASGKITKCFPLPPGKMFWKGSSGESSVRLETQGGLPQ